MTQPAALPPHLPTTATRPPPPDPPPANPAPAEVPVASEPTAHRRLVAPALFLEQLQRAANSTSPTVLLIVDLDDFHGVNRSNGFPAGDRLLQIVGARLAERLRPGDLVSRLAADEFAVLLRDVLDSASAVAVAREVLGGLRAPIVVGGRSLRASARAGIALCPMREHDIRARLLAARAAARKAKRCGIDVVIAEALDHVEPGSAPAWPAATRLDQQLTGREVRDGLLRGEFKLHFQPIHNFGTGHVDTLEALVRWRHPRHGMLGPASFLPAAERAGLAHVISVRVLDCACDSLRRWRQRGHRQLRVAVNLSATDLRRDDFAGTVAATLERHKLPASSLELELTEDEQLEDDQAMVQVGELARNGIGLTIDDFGIKYSSLRYLHKLPVRALKVDRSFVQDVGESAASTSIVSAVVDIAAKLGLRVVAEGVEHARQMNELRRLGCHIMQGFLFSPPVPADAIRGYLDRAAPAS